MDTYLKNKARKTVAIFVVIVFLLSLMPLPPAQAMQDGTLKREIELWIAV